jgi:hypothetical protein
VKACVLDARRNSAAKSIARSDCPSANNPAVAEAVAIELHRAGKPLWPAILIRTGRIPLVSRRPSRDLARALEGSQIVKTWSGAYWFEFERVPERRVPPKPPDTAYALMREFCELLWARAILALAGGPKSPKSIAEALRPEIGDANPDWLRQRLQREKAFGTVVNGRNGWRLKPRRR